MAAGYGVWFGEFSQLNVSSFVPSTDKQTVSRAELLAIVQAISKKQAGRGLHLPDRLRVYLQRDHFVDAKVGTAWVEVVFGTSCACGSVGADPVCGEYVWGVFSIFMGSFTY